MSEIVNLVVFAVSGAFDMFSKLVVALDVEKLLLEIFFVVVVARLIVSRLIGGGFSGLGNTIGKANSVSKEK